MNCKDTQNLIHGYIDGELDLVRNLEIEHHLQECSVCSQAYKNLQALRSVIKEGSLYFKPSMTLQKRVRSSLRRASKTRYIPRVVPWRWLTMAASLAFVVLMIGGLIRIWSIPSADDLLTQEVISSHVRSLMVDHLADVPSSDQHTVKPWFNGKLDFSPSVADLASQGFPLVGGRLDYLNNRPVAALVYQRRQHFINLFIWPSTHHSDVDTKTVTLQGYHLFHWTRSGMIYWVVSDLNNRELQEFVQLVQNQSSLSP